MSKVNFPPPPPDTDHIKPGSGANAVMAALAIMVALFLLALHVACRDDGMATCQLSHSFDVCHDSLH